MRPRLKGVTREQEPLLGAALELTATPLVKTEPRFCDVSKGLLTASSVLLNKVKHLLPDASTLS